MIKRELLTDSYNYELPKELIAYEPAKPRIKSRLLVYKKKSKEIEHKTFEDFFDIVPKDYLIILNNTKVIKARIFGKKASGGSIELLLIRENAKYDFLVNIKGKVKVDTILYFEEGLSAKIKAVNSDGSKIVNFFLADKILGFTSLLEILEDIGHVPLPPYIKRVDKKNDISSYQSVFAKHQGSVAAPTASLHFDEESFGRLKSIYKYAFVTLHIGAGTFKSVDTEDIREHDMHEEFFKITEENLKKIDSANKIITIGTTSTRTLEEYARSNEESGYCKLFLHPENRPIKTDALLTNFHMPKSTLIMLVASFIGLDETKRVYDIAIKEKYRFFSYGDAMLII